MINHLAQVDIRYKFFGGYGGSHGSAGPLASLTGVGYLVSLFVRGAFVSAGFILFIFLLIGGIGMIASAGGGDPQRAEQAKKTATSALIGFIVVFTSYFLVQLIGQFTGINILGQ